MKWLQEREHSVVLCLDKCDLHVYTNLQGDYVMEVTGADFEIYPEILLGVVDIERAKALAILKLKQLASDLYLNVFNLMQESKQ